MVGADKVAAIRAKAEVLAGRSLGDNGDALTEMTAGAAMAWCNREDIPEDMEGAVALMVAALAGESGAVKTIKRGDTSVTYDNGSNANYLTFLNPWRRPTAPITTSPSAMPCPSTASPTRT